MNLVNFTEFALLMCEQKIPESPRERSA